MLRNIKKKEETPKKTKISFWSKEKCRCPVCQRDFDKEEMLSGGGRMNAGELTDELHRLYIPSKNYGLIVPLIYSVGACPRCNIALFWSDFPEINDKEMVMKLRDTDDERKQQVEIIFPHFDLKKERSILDGAAMYYMALLTYDYVPAKYSPTIKRAILSLRLAWICNHLNDVIPGYNYDYVAKVFYQKARFFYEQTLLNETSGVEPVGGLGSFGPDIDKNYGYDGIIYLNALLEYKYGQTSDIDLRLKKFQSNKYSIARIFGLGKSSKAKPGPLLEKARELYDIFSKELKEANQIDLEDENEEEDA